MEAREAGSDVNALFYSKEEYQQAMDYIDFVLLDATPVEGGIKLKAKALAGANVEAEYQMCLLDDMTGEWVEIRGWSTNREFTFESGESGTYKFRVNAREVGSDVEYDRYRIAKATV